MSAVAQTDAGTHAANGEEVVHQASIEECLMIRESLPLPILLSALAAVLQKLEEQFATFVQSLPEIDPETLDPNDRNCAICWDEFKLRSKNNSLGLSERDSTPLQLPCPHHLCKACIQDWLLKAGTCPVCHHQCCPQIGPKPTFEHEQWFRFREAHEAMVEIAPIFFDTNPQTDSYGEFDRWLFAGEYNEYDTDDIKVRAQWAMDAFEEFTNTFGEFMQQGPEGRQRLMGIRAVLAARAAMEEGSREDEERGDEEDFMEDGPEGLDDAEFMPEGYGNNDEERESMDDDEDGFMDEGEDATKTAAAMEEEEDSMEESEDDDNEQDSMDENEDFDEVGDDDDEWEIEEIEVDEQHSPATVLGCATIVSMAGIGILMASRVP